MSVFKDIPEYVAKEKKLLKEKIKHQDLKPHLTVIQVGDDPASNSYIKGKKKDCDEVGISFDLVKLPSDISYEDFKSRLYDEIDKAESKQGGIIVQRPLPYDSFDILACKAIPDCMDVDGFGSAIYHSPCTSVGIMDYLEYCGYDLEGKTAMVIGRSLNVGQALAEDLLYKDATVIQAHSHTPCNVIEDLIWECNIVFTAIDKINYFDWSWYLAHPGLKIIDIGLGRNCEGKLKGNLKDSTVESMRKEGIEVISGIGGVGLLTRLALLKNVVNAYICQL